MRRLSLWALRAGSRARRAKAWAAASAPARWGRAAAAWQETHACALEASADADGAHWGRLMAESGSRGELRALFLFIVALRLALAPLFAATFGVVFAVVACDEFLEELGDSRAPRWLLWAPRAGRALLELFGQAIGAAWVALWPLTVAFGIAGAWRAERMGRRALGVAALSRPELFGGGRLWRALGFTACGAAHGVLSDGEEAAAIRRGEIACVANGYALAWDARVALSCAEPLGLWGLLDAQGLPWRAALDDMLGARDDSGIVVHSSRGASEARRREWLSWASSVAERRDLGLAAPEAPGSAGRSQSARGAPRRL